MDDKQTGERRPGGGRRRRRRGRGGKGDGAPAGAPAPEGGVPAAGEAGGAPAQARSGGPDRGGPDKGGQGRPAKGGGPQQKGGGAAAKGKGERRDGRGGKGRGGKPGRPKDGTKPAVKELSQPTEKALRDTRPLPDFKHEPRRYGVAFYESFPAAKADADRLRELASQFDQLNVVIRAEGNMDDPDLTGLGPVKVFAGAAWALIHERRKQEGWYEEPR